MGRPNQGRGSRWKRIVIVEKTAVWIPIWRIQTHKTRTTQGTTQSSPRRLESSDTDIVSSSSESIAKHVRGRVLTLVVLELRRYISQRARGTFNLVSCLTPCLLQVPLTIGMHRRSSRRLPLDECPWTRRTRSIHHCPLLIRHHL